MRIALSRSRVYAAFATSAVLLAVTAAHGQITDYYYANNANANWNGQFWSVGSLSTNSANWVTYPTGAPGSSINAHITTRGASARTVTITQDWNTNNLLFDIGTQSSTSAVPSFIIANTTNNTLNVNGGQIIFNWLANNNGGNMTAEIDSNLSTPGDLTVSVAGVPLLNNGSAFGDTTLFLRGASTSIGGSLHIGPGINGPNGVGANAVEIDSSATLTNTVYFDGNGACLAAGQTTGATAGLVTVHDIVLNPSNLAFTPQTTGNITGPGVFVSRIGGGTTITTGAQTSDTGSTLEVVGVISGNSDLQLSSGFNGGNGVVILDSQNTYTGNTFFSANTTGTNHRTQLAIDNALPTATNVFFTGTGGTLDLNGHVQSVRSFNAATVTSNNFITNSGGFTGSGQDPATLIITGPNPTGFTGSIGLLIKDSGGTVAITRSGADGSGTTILTNTSNTFSGDLTILGTDASHTGTLAVSSDAPLGSTSLNKSIVINGGVFSLLDDGAAHGFTLNSHRQIKLGPTSGAGSGTINVAPGSTFVVTNAILDNGGAGGLTVTGDLGVLQLTGTNSYTGPTNINSGTLSLGSSGALSASSIININSSGFLGGSGTAGGAVAVNAGGSIAPGVAAIQTSAATVGKLNLGSLTLNGGGNLVFKLKNGTATPTAGTDYDQANVAGSTTLASTVGNPFVVKAVGLSSLTGFSNSASNSWQIVKTGTLSGFDASAISVDTTSWGIGNPGSTLAVTSNGNGLVLNYTPGNPLSWIGGSGNWTATGGTSWNGGAWSSSAGASIGGATGTITLQDPITAAQGIAINTNGYVLQAAVAADTLTTPAIGVSNSSDSATVSAVISATNFQKNGAGTLTLTGQNAISGLVAVASGKLIGSAASLPSDIKVSGDSGASLVFNQTTDSVYSHALSGNGAVFKTGAGTLTLSGSNSLSNSAGLQIQAGTLAVATDAALGAAPAGVTIDGGALRTTSSFSTTRLFNVDTTGNGAGTVDVPGGVTLTLNGGTTSKSQIALNNAGTANGVFVKTGLGELVVSGASIQNASGFTRGAGSTGAGMIDVKQGTLTVGNKNDMATGTGTLNPRLFFGPTGATNNGLTLEDGTTFQYVFASSNNGPWTMSSLTVKGNATFVAWRTGLSQGISSGVQFITDGVSNATTGNTPLFLGGINGTTPGQLNLQGGGAIGTFTPRVSVGAITLTSDFTINQVSATNTYLINGVTYNNTYSENLTVSGLYTDNAHKLTVLGGANGGASTTNTPGAGFRLNTPSGANSATGDWVFGQPDGTHGALFSYGGSDNLAFTSGTITVNPSSQLLLFSGSGTTPFLYGPALTSPPSANPIHIKGYGVVSNPDFSNFLPGAITNTTGRLVNLNRNVILDGDATIGADGSVVSSAIQGNLVIYGSVTGSGTLTKAGSAPLQFLSASNNLTGATIVNGGQIFVGNSNDHFTGVTMGTGDLTLAQTSSLQSGLNASTTPITGVLFQNDAQTIGNLASSFTATTGTLNQVIELRGNSSAIGTVLTITEPGQTTFGNGPVSTLQSFIKGIGGIVLSSNADGISNGILTLTGANTFTGGATIHGGKLALTTGSIVGGLNVIVDGNGANLNGILGVQSTSNLTGTSTAVINSGGTLSVDGNFDASVILAATSSGIIALNTDNTALTGTNNTTAFIGSIGAHTLSTTTLNAGSGGVYRLGARGGALTVANGVLVGSSNSLLVGSGQANGIGTVILSGSNSYGGGTTINRGVLQVSADNNLGATPVSESVNVNFTGPGTLRAGALVTTLGGNRDLGVASSVVATVDSNGDTFTAQGALKLQASAVLNKTGSGTFETDKAPTLLASSVINVNQGTLKFNATSTGSGTVGAGVTANVAAGATLQLAGTAPALATSGRANVVTTAGTSGPNGLLDVTGQNQQIGAVLGTGDTTIESTGILTANSIVQRTLTVNGMLTLAPSDASGNSLGTVSSLSGASLAGSSKLSSLLLARSHNSAVLSGATTITSPSLGSGGVGSLSSGSLGSVAAVPEPSSLALSGLSLALGAMMVRRRRRTGC